MTGRTIRPGSLQPLLAACLTVLLIVTSLAPCCAFASSAGGTHVSAATDPCERRAAPVATSCACIQLSCQAFNSPAVAPLLAPGWSTPVAFAVRDTAVTDRDERPDHPPPRTLL